MTFIVFFSSLVSVYGYFYHFLDEGLGDAIELRKYGEAGRDILEIIKTKLNLV